MRGILKKIYWELENIYYSLPIQLLIIQFKRHKLILGFWLLLLGLISGTIGKEMGGAYLLLEPEYLGKEDFWSVFMVGSALGAFLFAYMITIYINESYHFPFIAMTRFPFITFSYNNLLIPSSFLLLYIYRFIEFHILSEGTLSWLVIERTSGLLTGIGIVFLVSASYFFAERNVLLKLGKHLHRYSPFRYTFVNSWIILGKARKTLREKSPADCYYLFPFQRIIVEDSSIDKFRTLIGQLSQHHIKLLTLQVLTFSLVAVLGLLESERYFQFPAGASFLLVFALAVLVLGAVSFWFRKVGALSLLILIGFLVSYDQGFLFKEKHHALGLDYRVAPAQYTPQHLDELARGDDYSADRAYTLTMLNNWKRKHQQKYGRYSKPKAVFVTASGGGLRSAFWTLKVLQQMDSLTQGQIADDLRLMTGASGGMFGLTYYRELQLREQQGQATPSQEEALANISKDLLNRITFKKFADVFLFNRDVQIGDLHYDNEMGYSFDDQLMINLPEFKDRTLRDYIAPEAEGLIPTLILTPTIVNQGRKLYISASPVSFLTRRSPITREYQSRSKGVEFRKFFADHRADDLLLATALRMNSTFPFILPLVELPSSPVMKILDAGAIDNFGTQAAIRYLYEFKDWFENNTEGVVVIQIRDTRSEPIIEDPSQRSIVDKLLMPINGGYTSMLEAKDTSNDYLLEFVHEWYDGYLEIVPFEYPLEVQDVPASLSWHLTKREKQSILSSIYTNENQRSFDIISALYQQDLIAQKGFNNYYSP